MSESNNVYENFEDALFRLFMDRVAVVEGERLLKENEALKQDPDAAVPEEVQQRCVLSIQKGIARHNRKTAGKTVRKIARFLPIAVIIALLMGLVAYAAFPAFRASILNLLMTENGRYTTWEYQENMDLPSSADELPFELKLPDEFYLVKTQISTSYDYAQFQSKFDASRIIEISLQHGEFISLKSDAEDIDYYEELSIQGCPAVIIEKDGYIELIMTNISEPYFLTINTNAIDRNELYRVAETLKYNN